MVVNPEGLPEPAEPWAQNPWRIIRKSLGLFVLYVTELVVEVPKFELGIAEFTSKGTLVLAPETPKSSQIVLIAVELNSKVMESADKSVEAMA